MPNNEELILVMKNWRVLVSKDFAIGFEGENDTRTLSIEVDDAADYDFKLDVETRDGRESKRNIIDLNKDGNVLSVLLKKEMLINSGVHRMQVRGIRGEEIRKSNIFHVHVFQSINAEDAFPDPLPSEFSQIEQRVTQLKNDAEDASAEAKRAEDSIQVWVGDDPPLDGSKLLQLLEVENPGEYLAVTRGEFNDMMDRIKELLLSSTIPSVSADDNGKTLMVVDGKWQTVMLSNAEEESY